MASAHGVATVQLPSPTTAEASYERAADTRGAHVPPEAASDNHTPVGRGSGAGGFNYLVVGAGLSGATIAREAAEAGKKVLVVDRRDHVGGNCFDYVHETGFRVAQYGPHFFHTASERVWDYVQRFSEWVPWEHRVTANVNGIMVPVPANMTTVNALFGTRISSEAEMDDWLAREQIPCATPANSRDVALSRVGLRLYDLLFSGYTRKQWAKGAEELEPSVLARIPVRRNDDDRYFTDPHQALPRHGYTRFIANMLAHPNIDVRTGVDFFAERHALRGYEKLFYTGPIDRFYADSGLDALEYRTVEFDWNVRPTPTPEARLQPTSQVNFPSVDVPHTRVTEYKHLPNQPTDTGLLHVPHTTLATEFSRGDGEPFYPVPAERNRVLYEKYKALAAADRDIVFVGRLATMKYINMDQAILYALQAADEHVPRAKSAAS